MLDDGYGIEYEFTRGPELSRALGTVVSCHMMRSVGNRMMQVVSPLEMADSDREDGQLRPEWDPLSQGGNKQGQASREEEGRPHTREGGEEPSGLEDSEGKSLASIPGETGRGGRLGGPWRGIGKNVGTDLRELMHSSRESSDVHQREQRHPKAP